jgi:hypothetical protein
MALGIILVQAKPDLGVQTFIALGQPLGQILMHSGLGNAEMPGGGPDGCAGFNDVHSQLTDTVLDRRHHTLPSDAVCCHRQFMKERKPICHLDTGGITL